MNMIKVNVRNLLRSLGSNTPSLATINRFYPLLVPRRLRRGGSLINIVCLFSVKLLSGYLEKIRCAFSNKGFEFYRLFRQFSFTDSNLRFIRDRPN